MSTSIDPDFWVTPNSWKLSVYLEEMGLPHTTHLINISKDKFTHKKLFKR